MFLTYLAISSAFVLNFEVLIPRHETQNLSSSTLSCLGSLPFNEAPSMSFSVKSPVLSMLLWLCVRPEESDPVISMLTQKKAEKGWQFWLSMLTWLQTLPYICTRVKISPPRSKSTAMATGLYWSASGSTCFKFAGYTQKMPKIYM